MHPQDPKQSSQDDSPENEILQPEDNISDPRRNLSLPKELERWRKWWGFAFTRRWEVESFVRNQQDDAVDFIIDLVTTYRNFEIQGTRSEEHIKELESKKRDLMQKYDESIQQGEVYRRRIAELENRLGESERRTRELRSYQEKFETFERQNKHLSQENQTLRLRLTQLENEKKETDNQLSGLMAQVASVRRDKLTTSTISAGMGKAEIVQEFQQFRDTLHRLAVELMSMRLQGANSVTRHRAKERAIIKVILSKYIFEERETHAQSPEQICKQIMQEIFSDLPISPELDEKLRLVVEEGLSLKLKILAADPPGRLLFVSPNAKFDTAQHELDAGSQEEGLVTMTVYPGYGVNEQLLEKVRIFVSD